MIQIQPWEASMVKEIEKAILSSDLGINPTNDGKLIRLVFPELTEERRKELAKDIKKKGEGAKVAVRNIRRDAMDHFKKVGKAEDISEDEIKDLEDRIKSRLQCGLVVDLHPTDYELRLGILQSKTDNFRTQYPGLKIAPGVLEFLAHRITSNVRVLEGALQRLFAFASLMGREINLDMTQECLADILRANDRKVSIEEIQRKVAEHYNIRLSDMIGPKRLRNIARPRQVAMYLAKVLTPRSYPEIGRKFGGRDHSTVIHAVRLIEELRTRDADMDGDVRSLLRQLES